MKLLSLLLVLLVFPIYAIDSNKYFLSFEVIGKASSKKMELSNGTSYLLYENSGGFTDNLGNYGNTFCYGKIELQKNIATNFNIICESINQNKEKFWGEFTRSETDIEAGVGKAIIVDGTGVYKNLINTECFFSTRYLNESYFSLTKCNLTKEIFEKLVK